MNLINNKIYVGVHSTNDLEDGYIGCGMYDASCEKQRRDGLPGAVRKYGFENFTVDILIFTTTKKLALEIEELIVDKEFIKRSDTYNVAKGGSGGNTRIGMTREKYLQYCRNISERSRGELNSSYGKPVSKQKRDLIRSRVCRWKYNTPLGEFLGVVQAAKAHEVDLGTIVNRCNSSNFPEYNRISINNGAS